jgi:uncharacterized protein (UPF0335 family)
MEQTTVSINGGKQIPLDKFDEVCKLAAGKVIGSQFPGLREFFNEIDRREEEISDIRSEINDCFDSYCSSHATDKDALKLAYKLYKAINKDKTKAEAMQFEYDKMAELLITDQDQLALFSGLTETDEKARVVNAKLQQDNLCLYHDTPCEGEKCVQWDECKGARGASAA